MSYKVKWEEKGARIIVERVLDNGFINASKRVTEDPRFADIKYLIVELKKVSDHPLDSETLKQLALSDTRAYKINPDLKVAVLSNGQLVNSLAHTYNLYFELANDGRAWDVKIFDIEKQACDWIAQFKD